MNTEIYAIDGEHHCFANQQPPFSIQFFDTANPEVETNEVGRFFIKDGQLAFEGNAHESAKIFLRELGEQWLQEVERRKAAA